MTQNNPMEKLREDIAETCGEPDCLYQDGSYPCPEGNGKSGSNMCDYCKADKIMGNKPLVTLLKIWEQSGYDTDRIVVLDKDQSLPIVDVPAHSRSRGCPHCGEEFGFEGEAEVEQEIAQQDMLKANFHKILPREEKR